MRSTFNHSVNFTLHFPTACWLYASSIPAGIYSAEMQAKLKAEAARKFKRSKSSDNVSAVEVALAGLFVVSSVYTAGSATMGLNYLDDAYNLGMTCYAGSTTAGGVAGGVAAGSAVTTVASLSMDTNQRLSEEIEKLNNEINLATTELNKTTEKLTKLEKEYETFKATHTEELRASETTNRTLIEQMRAYQNNIDTMIEEILGLQGKLETEQRKSKKLQSELTKLKETHSILAKGTLEVSRHNDALMAELGLSSRTNTDLTAQIKKLQKQLSVALDVCEDAEQRLRALKNTRSTATNSNRLTSPPRVTLSDSKDDTPLTPKP